MEIWKTIKEDNTYMISNLGRVKSLPKKHKNGRGYYITKEKMLKAHKNNKGYLFITINNKKIFIHRLVAEAFIDNPDNKPCVNHLDCNPLNNQVDNLEWCTHLENIQYMGKMKRNIRSKQWLDNMHEANRKSFRAIRGVHKETGKQLFYECINDAKKDNFNIGCICACCKGYKNFKSYKGYKWEYVD